MAQSNFEERIDTYEIESTNVMTGTETVAGIYIIN